MAEHVRRDGVSRRDSSGRSGRGRPWIAAIFRVVGRWRPAEPPDSKPAADVLPWMAPLVGVGLLAGAALAATLSGIDGFDFGGLVLRGLWGAAAGGLLGAFLAMILAVEVPRWRHTNPPPPRTEELWDRWLDEDLAADGVILEDVAGVRQVLVPEPARVRPRVLSDVSGESLPLMDEVVPLLRSSERGAVRIVGPPGSGKTVALRHLAAMLPGDLRVRVLDEPDRTTLADQSVLSLVVYASAESDHAKHLATYRLAPWGVDELIEYLLAAAPGRCASVMARLEVETDRAFFQGCPELWRIVLDRMADDETLATARDALRRECSERLGGAELRSRVEELCLDLQSASDAGPAGDRGLIEACGHDERMHRLLRHRPVRLLLAADRIADDLERGTRGAYLDRRLPRELVQETASVLRMRPWSIAYLLGLVAGSDRPCHPMAASLLHAAGNGWKPEGDPRPRLCGAYLDRAAWPGIDLSGAELSRAVLDRADLSRARLDGVRASGARLRRALLRGASLANAKLDAAELMQANLGSIRAQRAWLQDANLEGAILEGASLVGASLVRANLAGARLSDADLSDARLEGANIEGTDLGGANLAGAVLRGLKLRLAECRGARFAKADLSRCDLEGMDLPSADFREAKLRGALLTGSTIPGGDFRGACLQDAGLAEVEWEGACLAGADLRRASFHLGSSRSGLVQSPIACEGSRTGFYTDDFNEQDFKSPEEIRKANLRGADLRGARVEGVDFYLVDLRGARFDAQLAGHFRRCGAILESRG